MQSRIAVHQNHNRRANDIHHLKWWWINDIVFRHPIDLPSRPHGLDISKHQMTTRRRWEQPESSAMEEDPPAEWGEPNHIITFRRSCLRIPSTWPRRPPQPLPATHRKWRPCPYDTGNRHQSRTYRNYDSHAFSQACSSRMRLIVVLLSIHIFTSTEKTTRRQSRFPSEEILEIPYKRIWSHYGNVT